MIKVDITLEKLQSLFCIDDVEDYTYTTTETSVDFDSDSDDLKYILDMNGIQYEAV